MQNGLQIKEGLFYSLKQLQEKEVGAAYLLKKQKWVVLKCNFQIEEPVSGNETSPTFFELQFQFDIAYLEQYSSHNYNLYLSLNASPNEQHEICSSMQLILYEIIHCKLTGFYHNVFLESKALALLLCFQKNNTINEQECSACKFLTKPIEKDKIMYAKTILEERLGNPPTIAELSLQIGINQCYLKKGFKEIYGTTIYHFIQEQRMEKAKYYLLTTPHSVSQIAEDIGFSSVSNFSSAFKKYVGVFPSELQRK